MDYTKYGEAITPIALANFGQWRLFATAPFLGASRESAPAWERVFAPTSSMSFGDAPRNGTVGTPSSRMIALSFNRNQQRQQRRSALIVTLRSRRIEALVRDGASQRCPNSRVDYDIPMSDFAISSP